MVDQAIRLARLDHSAARLHALDLTDAGQRGLHFRGRAERIGENPMVSHDRRG